MFNIGGGEFLVIALIALIVLGPQRLPDAARQVGKVMGDLRRMSSGFQNELRGALNEPDTAPTQRPNPVAPAATSAVTEAVASVSQEPPIRRTPLQAAPATKGVEKQAPARPAAAKRAAPKKEAAKTAAPAKKTSSAKTAADARKPAASKAAAKRAKKPAGGARSVPPARRPRTKGS